MRAMKRTEFNIEISAENVLESLGVTRQSELYEEMQEEISLLTTNYKQLQNKILENSPLHKELIHLANQNKPRNNKPLITDKQ